MVWEIYKYSEPFPEKNVRSISVMAMTDFRILRRLLRNIYIKLRFSIKMV